MRRVYNNMQRPQRLLLLRTPPQKGRFPIRSLKNQPSLPQTNGTRGGLGGEGQLTFQWRFDCILSLPPCCPLACLFLKLTKGREHERESFVIKHRGFNYFLRLQISATRPQLLYRGVVWCTWIPRTWDITLTGRSGVMLVEAIRRERSSTDCLRNMYHPV